MSVVANRYDYGDQIPVKAEFTVDGAYVDPATIILKVRKPDKSTVTYTYGIDAAVIKSAVGKYYLDLLLNQEGDWYYRWEVTGSAVLVEEKRVNVKESPFY